MATLLDATLTTSQAARILGLSDQSVRALARSGKLPATQTPLGMLLDPLAVHALAAEREREQRERVTRRQAGNRGAEAGGDDGGRRNTT